MPLIAASMINYEIDPGHMTSYTNGLYLASVHFCHHKYYNKTIHAIKKRNKES